MKVKEIRKKTEEECLRIIKEKQKKLKEFYFSTAVSGSKNNKEALNLRRDIARIKTILKEKKYEK